MSPVRTKHVSVDMIWKNNKSGQVEKKSARSFVFSGFLAHRSMTIRTEFQSFNNVIVIG